MIRRVAARLAWSAAVLVAALSLTFALSLWIPADPARALVGPHADAATVTRLRHDLCLDRGLAVAYGCYVGRIARGDLGTSFRTGRPVAAILAERIGPSAELALAALLLQILAGVPLGVLAARRGRAGRAAADAFSALGASLPAFFLGPLAMYVVGFELGWLPVSGHGAAGLDRLRHLVLPACTLAFTGVAAYTRLVAAELADVLVEDHVRTARAKGLSPRAVLVRHGLRNVLPPLVALAGVDLGVLLGGTVVVETVFGWPGLGREAVLAILNVDLPVVLGVVIVGAGAVVVSSVLADLTAAALDPRLR